MLWYTKKVLHSVMLFLFVLTVCWQLQIVVWIAKSICILFINTYIFMNIHIYIFKIWHLYVSIWFRDASIARHASWKQYSSTFLNMMSHLHSKRCGWYQLGETKWVPRHAFKMLWSCLETWCLTSFPNRAMRLPGLIMKHSRNESSAQFSIKNNPD